MTDRPTLTPLMRQLLRDLCGRPAPEQFSAITARHTLPVLHGRQRTARALTALDYAQRVRVGGQECLLATDAGRARWAQEAGDAR